MQVPHYAALRAAEEFYWGMMPLVILRRALRGWIRAQRTERLVNPCA